MNNLPQILRTIMAEKNIDENQFAKMIGSNKSLVKSWLDGKSKPRYKSLKAICKGLNVKADIVLGLEKQKKTVG